MLGNKKPGNERCNIVPFLSRRKRATKGYRCNNLHSLIFFFPHRFPCMDGSCFLLRYNHDSNLVFQCYPNCRCCCRLWSEATDIKLKCQLLKLGNARMQMFVFHQFPIGSRWVYDNKAKIPSVITIAGFVNKRCKSEIFVPMLAAVKINLSISGSFGLQIKCGSHRMSCIAGVVIFHQEFIYARESINGFELMGNNESNLVVTIGKDINISRNKNGSININWIVQRCRLQRCLS